MRVGNVFLCSFNRGEKGVILLSSLSSKKRRYEGERGDFCWFLFLFLFFERERGGRVLCVY